jgi:hypothetical protein
LLSGVLSRKQDVFCMVHSLLVLADSFYRDQQENHSAGNPIHLAE